MVGGEIIIQLSAKIFNFLILAFLSFQKSPELETYNIMHMFRSFRIYQAGQLNDFSSNSLSLTRCQSACRLAQSPS